MKSVLLLAVVAIGAVTSAPTIGGLVHGVGKVLKGDVGGGVGSIVGGVGAALGGVGGAVTGDIAKHGDLLGGVGHILQTILSTADPIADIQGQLGSISGAPQGLGGLLSSVLQSIQGLGGIQNALDGSSGQLPQGAIDQLQALEGNLPQLIGQLQSLDQNQLASLGLHTKVSGLLEVLISIKAKLPQILQGINGQAGQGAGGSNGGSTGDSAGGSAEGSAGGSHGAVGGGSAGGSYGSGVAGAIGGSIERSIGGIGGSNGGFEGGNAGAAAKGSGVKNNNDNENN